MDDRDSVSGMKAHTGRIGERPLLFAGLAAAVVALTGFVFVVLAVSYYLMVNDQSYGFLPSAAPVPEAAPANSSDDPHGALQLNFSRDGHTHFFRKNSHAGNILVITGTVRSNYSQPRSFVKLRGFLLSADGKALADRFVYAGNVLSEEELITLPAREIIDRLMVRDGRGGLNRNIQPGENLPFMFVFDILPDGMAEYRIDPVSSEPAE